MPGEGFPEEVTIWLKLQNKYELTWSLAWEGERDRGWFQTELNEQRPTDGRLVSPREDGTAYRMLRSCGSRWSCIAFVLNLVLCPGDKKKKKKTEKSQKSLIMQKQKAPDPYSPARHVATVAEFSNLLGQHGLSLFVSYKERYSSCSLLSSKRKVYVPHAVSKWLRKISLFPSYKNREMTHVPWGDPRF